jgi:hypothetical protein
MRAGQRIRCNTRPGPHHPPSITTGRRTTSGTIDAITHDSLNVFLCHSSGDKPAVRSLYQRLKSDGFKPWLDEENLVAGQDWDREIRRAVRISDVVVVCLSRFSITKEGYVQKEIRQALDVAQEKPPGTIFIIPVRLEACTVPEPLNLWHWVDYFTDNGHDRLLRALRARATALQAASAPPSQPSKSRETHTVAAEESQSNLPRLTDIQAEILFTIWEKPLHSTTGAPSPLKRSLTNWLVETWKCRSRAFDASSSNSSGDGGPWKAPILRLHPDSRAQDRGATICRTTRSRTQLLHE